MEYIEWMENGKVFRLPLAAMKLTEAEKQELLLFLRELLNNSKS